MEVSEIAMEYLDLKVDVVVNVHTVLTRLQRFL